MLRIYKTQKQAIKKLNKEKELLLNKIKTSKNKTKQLKLAKILNYYKAVYELLDKNNKTLGFYF